MGSLISMLATVVLISTVSTLIFATFAYIASRRPERKKKRKAPVESAAPMAMPEVAPTGQMTLKTFSMDGTARTVPIILVPDVDRAEQLAQAWSNERAQPAATIGINDGNTLFKTFQVEEDAHASLN